MTIMRSSLSYYKLKKKYKQVDKDFPITDNITLVITRPFDWPALKRLYPPIHHTFFRTIEGDYGYQFCDWGNPNCPEEFGPKILPDNTKYLTTKDNWTYFLITKDLGKTNCIRRTVFELYPKYTFSNEIEAILWNVCNKFVEDVLKKCKV